MNIDDLMTMSQAERDAFVEDFNLLVYVNTQEVRIELSKLTSVLDGVRLIHLLIWLHRLLINETETIEAFNTDSSQWWK